MRVVVADGDDSVTVSSGITVATELAGGDGRDTLTGGSGGDTVSGGAGGDRLSGGGAVDVVHGDDDGDILLGTSGADILFGDDGDDLVVPLDRDQEAFGGPGVDTVPLQSSGSGSDRFPFTLDDVANDGAPADGLNLHGDLENIDASMLDVLGPTTTANLALTGSAGPNMLRGGVGDDVLDGQGGGDVLRGEDGDDELLARDGAMDLVACGGGDDRAVVDAVDQVVGCERVDAAPAPAAPAPAVTTVVAPPPAPLVVPATRTLVVPRLSFDRSRDRRAPYRFRVTGRVTPPPGTTAADVCREGFVAVVLRSGNRTVQTVLTLLRRNCTFTAALRTPRRGRYTVRARFSGNAVLRDATSATGRLRAG